jgi:putative pyridoxal-dependent aspartate 1-decarboxylase
MKIRETKLESLEELPKISEPNLRENITSLFKEENSPATYSRIFALAQEFITASNASSRIEFHDLVEEFQKFTIPEYPGDLDNQIDYLKETIVKHSNHTSSPRFIGHMTSALPSFVLLLNHLMTAMNQNMVKTETSKALTPYERQSLAIIHRLLYNFSDDFYKENIQDGRRTLGIMVSGGTVANITALWCARNAALGSHGEFLGVEKEGLLAALEYYGHRGAVVIGSSLMHYSFDKAADLLGIGTRNLIKLPTDGNYRIDLDALRREIDRCREKDLKIIAIVGIAGTTDTGSIDPLLEMARIAKDAKIHFHVDAAWGGPLIFSDRNRHKLSGIELADSVTIDGHKQLYLSMGIGMVMFRDPYLAKVIEKNAKYIVRAGSVDLGKRSLEGSRPAMALLLNAALEIIGRKGYEFLIDEGVRKTQYMADLIKASEDFELLTEPVSNILVYRYVPISKREAVRSGKVNKEDNQFINLFNEQIQKVQRGAGYTFVSRTTLDNTKYGKELGIVSLRVVLANPLTTEDDIEAVLNEQRHIADTIDEESLI